MVTTTTNTDELAKIIRRLMYFIINDGKKCIDDNLKKVYVSKYLFLFAKIMNQVDEPNDPEIAQLISIITKDIETSDYNKN
ncbi:hypothetical protein [Aquimarina agarivorans]|uniref:hypothetical protein n=1 Tax=Aquimarina agarivorans TaxID=980584 RepID=UPI000248E6CD|nr:hypothetical protein [Aquimarina agarivorans]